MRALRGPFLLTTILLALVGGALWWVGGHWQWLLTLVPLPMLALDGYVAFNDVVRSSPLVSQEMREAARASTRAERLVDWFARLVIFAGLVAWAWTGRWALAVLGVVVGGGILAATTVVQSRRRRHLDEPTAG